MSTGGRIKDKVCIVTGASSGIGKGIAELFAQEGATVVLTDIQEEKGKQAAEEIKSKGYKASFFNQDVSNENTWANLMEYTLNNHKKLDVLVNNAGIGFVKSISEMTLADLRKVLSINLESVFLGCKHGAETMKRSQVRGGSIINISSNMIYAPMKKQSAYCMSKTGVAIFTRVAAMEFAKDGIRVNTVYPGFTETAILDVAFREAEKLGKTRDEMFEMFGQANLLGYVGKPLDIAYSVLFLASDEARYVTGADFVIDGGEVWQRGGLEQEMSKAEAAK
jgi:NAD(P)-dependent dehydrogenase (short-subunit alcohol dehydrogenase family)